MDSGATNHVTRIASLFINYRQLQPGERAIKVADDRYIDVAETGDIIISFDNGNKIILQAVLHVVGFGNNNLLSVFRLLSDGFKVDFTINSARLLKDKKAIATRPVFGKMFYLKTLDGVVNHSNPSESTFLTKTLPSDDAILWHNRLGHLSLRAVKKLSGHVDGLKIQGTIPDTCLCEACIIGKLHRKPFLPVAKRSTTPIGLTHSDVVGPFQVRSHRRNRYMLVFTDDCTRWSDAYYTPEKSNVPEKFQIFEAKMENLGHKIQYLRTDRGGEYSSAEFISYLDQRGITRQITALIIRRFWQVQCWNLYLKSFVDVAQALGKDMKRFFTSD